MRVLALAGIAGPLLFVVTVVSAAALRPGYSHVDQFISELGATGTAHAVGMNYAGFFPVGLLFTVFGASIAALLPRRPLHVLAALLVTVFGIGVVLAGLFSCDAGCPQSGGTIRNTIHNRVAPTAFLSIIAATLVLGIAFRSSPRARRLWPYSVISGALALVFLALLVGSLETRILTGLWQRLMIATLLLWSAIVGLHVYRNASAPAPPP